MKKVVGIVGGMGPEATSLLYQFIIENVEAKTDQEHIHILIDSNPEIPDRTASIKMNSVEPLLKMADSANRLVKAGAELIAIPCNTAHFYYDQMQERVPVPIIHMIRETAGHCRKEGFEKVGILATDGTVGTDLYRKELQKVGIEAVYPSEGQQKRVMSAIYDYVKAGRKIEEDYLSGCIAELEGEGCQAFILGCTELPIIFKARRGDPRYVNTLQVLARAVIERSGYVCRRTGG